jgi:hypothetical protein
MDKFIGTVLRIASGVATPLALGGLIVGVILIVFKQILSMNIFPQLTSETGGVIILRIINVLFILCGIAIIFGFAAYVLPMILAARYPKLDTEVVEMDSDRERSFQEIVSYMESKKNVTIRFENGSEDVQNSLIGPFKHRADNLKVFLEQLGQRARGPSINYLVKMEAPRRYLISREKD